MLAFRSNRGRPRTAGFSLVEIITVLALFGLIAGILLNGSSALLRSIAKEDAEQAVMSAVASARHQAVLSGQPLTLHYDEATRLLTWAGGQTALVGEDTIRLLPPVRTSSVLIGGKLMETAITQVRFYPDGSCDPFRLEVIRNGISQYLNIDPWTCTMLADAAEERR